MGKSDRLSMATAKQVAYIKTLKGDLGEENLEIIQKELSVEKPSAIIEGLLSKMGRNTCETRHVRKVNEPRLGMAMKECFRLWRRNGHDIYEKRRKLFKENVIETYWLFTEIAEVVEQGGRAAAIEE
jgi:hypothetical protein